MLSKFLNKIRDVAESIKEIAQSTIDIIDAVFNIKDSFARIFTRNTQIA